MIFCLQSKELFLTYPQVPATLTKEQVLNQLRGKLKVVGYIVKEKLHLDGGKHFHVYLRLSTRCKILSPTRLDLNADGVTCHGNYQAARSVDNVREYCLKDGEGSSYITNLELDSSGNEVSLETKLLRMLKEVGLTATLDYFYTNHEDMVFKKLSSYVRTLTMANKILKSKTKSVASYPSSDYVYHPEIDGYIADPNPPKHTLYVSGGSNLAKTSAIMAKAVEYGENFLFMRHLDQLKKYNPEFHTILIFDDIRLPRDHDSLISLFDVEEDTCVNVKFDAIMIPKGTRRIQISNMALMDMLAKRNLQDDQAIIRRVQEVKLTKSLRKITIENTNTTKVTVEHNYN